MNRIIFRFGVAPADGSGDMKDLLGGKGAGLAEMTNAGIPVPPGFTVATTACRLFFENNNKLPEDLWEKIKETMKWLEGVTSKGFGSNTNPLLVSVRSGAKISMPGMMDTILNLGLNEVTVEGLKQVTGDGRFAYDAYRRFIQMFADVVFGIPRKEFETLLNIKIQKSNKNSEIELDEIELRELIEEYIGLFEERADIPFPMDVYDQLKAAVEAVFRSWNNERAIVYRRANNIPDDLGTAVNIQSMVFGNMGNDSGTGVGFTRNPSNGKKEFYGEFLLNAQGEDVVAGIRTPMPISKLQDLMPEVFEQLKEITDRLEKHYRDVQDFEFTIERGKLYMLQTRNGKRTGRAAVKIAVDMVEEGLISEKEALLRVEPSALDQLLHPEFVLEEKKRYKVVAEGLGASPGAASGVIVLDSETAIMLAKQNKDVILVRPETEPDDINGMIVSRGILTATGGNTSHAAVVSRQMGKPAVVGCGVIDIDLDERKIRIKNLELKEGDYISIDGTTGEVMPGRVPMRPSEIIRVLNGEISPDESEQYQYFATLLDWADKYRRLGIRANGDRKTDAELAVKFGAEGIGLCRTEHMFFEKERIPLFREFILTKDREHREKLLKKLEEFQRKDFYEIFVAMGERPVTIRTLDPPLHEFLPRLSEIEEQLRGNPSEQKRKELLLLKRRVEELTEQNPMLGHRGCRLGISNPEITRMQASAIFNAAIDAKEDGIDVKPEIMIPLVGSEKELEHQKRVVDETAERVFKERGKRVEYRVGTMIELPRACMVADRIAEHAEFFSFGTNDLTQTTFGFSRDDIGKFIGIYLDEGILKKNPFATLDTDGVGKLMQICVEKAKSRRKDIKLGICGEHGGDPDSIAFCDSIGLNYVSCSPFRLPVARLAAARSAIEAEGI